MKNLVTLKLLLLKFLYFFCLEKKKIKLNIFELEDCGFSLFGIK